MNRRDFLAATASLIATRAMAREEAPAPTRQLFSMWGASSKSVFAVGYASGAVGLILHSKDQGETWSQPKSQTTQTLYSIWGVPQKGIYAVGAKGTIVRSTDQGKTWSKQKSNTKRALYAVAGVSAKEVFAVGEAGTILHTKDSGKTWAALQSDTAQTLSSICIESKTKIYVGGVSGGLVLSTDGGATWSTQKSPTKEKIVAIQSQKSTGFLLVDSTQVLRSSDAGKTWAQDPLTEKLFGFFHYTESHWLIPGAEGKMYTSLDKGLTWSETKSGLHSSLRAIWGIDKEIYVSSEHGGVVYSSDAGKAWKILLQETLRGH